MTQGQLNIESVLIVYVRWICCSLIWNKKQANVIQVVLFIGRHTQRSQGQTNSSPEWFVLKWPSVSMALLFIHSISFMSLSISSHTKCNQCGNQGIYKDVMSRRYLTVINYSPLCCSKPLVSFMEHQMRCLAE